MTLKEKERDSQTTGLRLRARLELHMCLNLVITARTSRAEPSFNQQLGL